MSLGLKESYLGDLKEEKIEDGLPSEAPSSDAQPGDSDSDGEAAGHDSEDDDLNAVSADKDKYVDQENDDLHVLEASKKSSTVLAEVPPLQVELDLDENGPEPNDEGDGGDEEDLEAEEDGDGTEKGRKLAKKQTKKKRCVRIPPRSSLSDYFGVFFHLFASHLSSHRWRALVRSLVFSSSSAKAMWTG